MARGELSDYINVKKVQQALASAREQIAATQHELEQLRAEEKDLEQLLAMANGSGELSGTTTAAGSSRTSRSVDPQQVIDTIEAMGGRARLDDLKDALGVGGRVIGGALRKDDRLSKDDEGFYTVAG